MAYEQALELATRCENQALQECSRQAIEKVRDRIGDVDGILNRRSQLRENKALS